MANDEKPKDPTLAELWKLQELRRKDRQQFTSRRRSQGGKSPLNMKQVLTAFFAKDPETKQKMEENFLILAWTRIVGDTAARYSRAVRVRNRTLYVHVDDPLWMQQLTFLKQAILEKYRAEFPRSRVTDLYFFRERGPAAASHSEQSR